MLCHLWTSFSGAFIYTGILPFQVLLHQREISGEEIDFILNQYPTQTPVSQLLEEENPGTLPFFTPQQERVHELEYSLLTPSRSEIV